MKFNRFNEVYNLILEELEQDKDYIYQDMTLAIVPGSFKPPHKGHWEMVMSYVDKVDKVIVLISNISTAAISSRPMSAMNLKDLGKLKEQIEWMKNTWAPSPRIDEDYQIISDLFEKSSSLTYSELKDGLEKIRHSNMLRSPEYGRFRMAIGKYLTKLEKNLFTSIRKTANGNEITPEQSKQIFEIFARAYGVEDKVDVQISMSASPITATFGLVNNACLNCKILLGVSKKGGDEARWNGLKQSEENPTNEIIPSPVEVQTMLSATELRNGINDLKKEWFPDKLSNEDFEEIKMILLR